MDYVMYVFLLVGILFEFMGLLILAKIADHLESAVKFMELHYVREDHKR